MSEYIWIVMGVLAIIGFALYKKRRKNAPTKSDTPWALRHSQGATLELLGTGWRVTVPQSPGYLGTVSWVDQPTLRDGGTIHLRYRVEGGSMAQVEAPAGPAPAMGVMIQRRGDTLSGRGKYAGYRWYAGVMLSLAPGEHMANIPLEHGFWGPVMGDPQAASFQECLQEADSLNIVFGGTSGRAHGVFAIEPATVALLGCDIT